MKKISFINIISIIMILLIYSNQCFGYSDEDLVNAIYLAEGGAKTKYPYGIKSIKCESEQECRKICFNTVRNNRKRYKADNMGYKDFIAFLGARYAPIGAENDPKNLNRNWVKNVRYYLRKGGKVDQ